MLKDLKAFLLRGNVVDLAVGVIIATAFGAIVTSLVNDIITPLILNPALEAAKVQNIAELAWNGVTYGKFLSAVINFLVIGTVLFFVIKGIEKLKVLLRKKLLRKLQLVQLSWKYFKKSKPFLRKNNRLKGFSTKLNPFFFTLSVTYLLSQAFS